jgi:CheY-like chemotaxis protein
MSYILIVEDDRDIAENLKELLELEGYAAEIARDGQQAINRIKGQPFPKVILLDLMMPLMDGFQFREEQLKDPAMATIPVVVMTAGGKIELKVQKMNAQAYFRKPLDIDNLLKTIANFAIEIRN